MRFGELHCAGLSTAVSPLNPLPTNPPTIPVPLPHPRLVSATFTPPRPPARAAPRIHHSHAQTPFGTRPTEIG